MPQAFTDLVRRHQQRVYSLCLRVLGDAEAAADVAQDTFLTVLRKLDGFRGEAAFTTWLHRVTMNACYDELRVQRRRPMLHVAPDDGLEREPGPPIVDHADEVGGTHRRGGGAGLDPRGVPHRAWCSPTCRTCRTTRSREVLDVPVGTVKSRVHRGRLALAAALGIGPVARGTGRATRDVGGGAVTHPPNSSPRSSTARSRRRACRRRGAPASPAPDAGEEVALATAGRSALRAIPVPQGPDLAARDSPPSGLPRSRAPATAQLTVGQGRAGARRSGRRGPRRARRCLGSGRPGEGDQTAAGGVAEPAPETPAPAEERPRLEIDDTDYDEEATAAKATMLASRLRAGASEAQGALGEADARRRGRRRRLRRGTPGTRHPRAPRAACGRRSPAYPGTLVRIARATFEGTPAFFGTCSKARARRSLPTPCPSGWRRSRIARSSRSHRPACRLRPRPSTTPASGSSTGFGGRRPGRPGHGHVPGCPCVRACGRIRAR